MSVGLAVLLVAFTTLLLLEVPVAFVIGLATLLGALALGRDGTVVSVASDVANGLDPVHFGIVIIANLCIGLCTPPVGTCLFLGCGVGRATIAQVVPAAIPFFVAMILALLAITYIPALSLFLPKLFGLM